MFAIVKGLIERGTIVAKRAPPDRSKFRWLPTEIPKIYDEVVHHDCPCSFEKGYGTTSIVAMHAGLFLFNMQPEAGVVVYVGTCPRCGTTLFAEREDEGP